MDALNSLIVKIASKIEAIQMKKSKQFKWKIEAIHKS